MKACIYARTSTRERRHTTTKIEHQVEFCRALARQHNVTVEPEHVFTDVELTGDLPPTCWAFEDAPSRPALSALVSAIEQDGVRRVIVRRLEKLGTASDVLLALRELLDAHEVYILAAREAVADDSDPNSAFAFSILKGRLLLDTEEERERKTRTRARKLEEIDRLRDKIARLEAEIEDL